MSDLKMHTDNVKAGESWLERIKRYIPGYDGYVNKDNMRELDTILRNSLAEKLESNKTHIKNAVLTLSQSGKLFETSNIEKLEKKNESIIAKFRSAARGYSGAFDVKKINEDTLNRLYEFDYNLLSFAENINKDFSDLESKAKTDIKDQIDLVSKNLDDFLEKFTERENILRQ